MPNNTISDKFGEDPLLFKAKEVTNKILATREGIT